MNRSLLLVALTRLVAGATAEAQIRIDVGQNVHVSAARPNEAHNEVLMAADPTNSNRLVACPYALPVEHVQHPIRPKLGNLKVYLSDDAGKSWRFSFEMPTDRSRGNNDVHCGFGVNGEVVVIMVVADPTPLDSTLGGNGKVYGIVRRSTDNGHTWSPEILLPESMPLDRQYIIVDDTHGKYRGRMYITGNTAVFTTDKYDAGAFGFWRSLDGGATWERPVKLLTKVDVVGKQYSGGNSWNTVVTADGTLVFAFADFADSGVYAIKVITSSDGGDSFSRERPVARVTHNGYSPVVLAVDRSNGPFRGRLYVSWDETVRGQAVMMSVHSDDTGKTWSHPVMVSDARRREDGGPDLVLCTIAVNKDGVVGALWQDRRDHPDNKGYYVRFAASLDGGDTWSPSVRVSTEPKRYLQGEMVTTDARTTPQHGTDAATIVNVDWREWFEAGHTSGFAADGNGIFQAVWIDNRTGVHQAWGAPITVQGAVARNGGGALASYRDVSNQAEVELVSTHYDESAKRVTVTVRIKNVSTDILRGPLALRLVSMTSDIAVVSAMNTMNGVAGAGAAWDAADLTPDGGLAPGQASRDKQLVFSLSDVRSLKPFRGEFDASILNFRARVLAK